MNSFIKKSTLRIPNFKNIDVGSWIACRFIETFWWDDVIEQFIKSRGKRWDKELYSSRLAGVDNKGLISFDDYMSWLTQLRNSIPQRYKWKNPEQWIQIIATMYWPYTFEQCKNNK